MSIRSRVFYYVTKKGYIHRYRYFYGYWREGDKIKCKYLGSLKNSDLLRGISLSSLSLVFGINDERRKSFWLGQLANCHLICQQLQAIRYLENDGDLLDEEKARLLEKIRKGLKGNELKDKMDLYRLKRVLTPS